VREGDESGELGPAGDVGEPSADWTVRPLLAVIGDVGEPRAFGPLTDLSVIGDVGEPRVRGPLPLEELHTFRTALGDRDRDVLERPDGAEVEVLLGNDKIRSRRGRLTPRPD